MQVADINYKILSVLRPGYTKRLTPTQLNSTVELSLIV